VTCPFFSERPWRLTLETISDKPFQTVKWIALIGLPAAYDSPIKLSMAKTVRGNDKGTVVHYLNCREIFK